MHRERESIAVAGLLEAEELPGGGLRVVDDAGNRITIERSVNAEVIPRQFVGKRVVAGGRPAYDELGRLRALTAVTIEPALVPTQWKGDAGSADWRLPQTPTSPDPDGGADFDDDEWAEFLAAVGVVVRRGEEERD